MIVLYILLGLIAIIFVLAFMPISVFLKSNGDFKAVVKFLGIKLFDSSKEKKQKDKQKNEETEKVKQKKESKAKELFIKEKEKSGTIGAIKYFSNIFKAIMEDLLWFIKKLRFDHIKLNLIIATDDAADTAIKYGTACTALYPVLSILTANAKVYYKKINISADFNKTATTLDLSLSVKVRLIYAVIGAFKGYKEYKIIVKDEKTNG